MAIEIKKPVFWVILIALGIAIGLIAALNLELSVYIALGFLCILLPVMFLRPLWGLLILLIIRPSLDILGQTLTVTLRRDLTINLAAILAILVIVWSVFYLLKNRPRLDALPLLWPWLIFLAVAAASIAVSADRFASFTEWIRLLSIFAIFLVAFDLARVTQKGRTILVAIIISVIIPLGVGLWQLINGQGIYEISTDLTRVPGTFAHPNSLAFYLVLVLALVLILLLSKPGSPISKKEISRVYSPRAIGNPGEITAVHDERSPMIKANKFWLILLALPALVLLFFTYTRGAWVALGIILIILGIVKWKRRFVIILLIIALAIGLFIFASSQSTRVSEFNITRTEFYQRLISIVSPESGQATSISWRVQMWGDLLTQAFPAQPIMGYGIGMYVPTSLIVHGYLEEPLEAHNDYVMMLIEAGIVGLAAYLFLIISTIVKVIKTARASTGGNKQAAIILAAALAAIFIMSFGDNVLRMTALQWALWSSIAVILAPESLKALAKPSR